MSVTLYGMQLCSACKRAVDYLNDNKIEYKYIDISTEEGLKIAREKGIKSVPVLEIDNRKILGFNVLVYDIIFKK